MMIRSKRTVRHSEWRAKLIRDYSNARRRYHSFDSVFIVTSLELSDLVKACDFILNPNLCGVGEEYTQLRANVSVPRPPRLLPFLHLIDLISPYNPTL
jgi:hypothetical protein